MESVTIVLMLMVAVVISGIVARMVPVPLPRPLFQIALGALIGLIADWRVTLDPEIFFLLFLPPLLFLDGWRIPREELFKDGRTVLGLALGLVVFTVVGMGFFIHWMIPSMPLPVAFALAAVISIPLGIAKASGALTNAAVDANPHPWAIAANLLLTLTSFAAILSIGIGFLNLLPIPILDGGHLLFYGYEAVARQPVAARYQEAGYRVGLALLAGLMLFATWNDLQKLNLFKFLGGLVS